MSIQLIEGKTYHIRSSSGGFIRWKYDGLQVIPGYTSKYGSYRTNTVKRFCGTNLATGRIITLKSMSRIITQLD